MTTFPSATSGQGLTAAMWNQAKASVDELQVVTATTTWQAMTLQSAFIDSNPGTGYAPAYRLATSLMVQLRGTINRGSLVVAGAVLFNLPIGFRPAAQILLEVFTDTSGTLAQFRLNVASNGDVTNAITYPQDMVLFLNGVVLPVG